MHNPAVTKYDMHVISGGQTGVDLAGLRAAQILGFKTGGLAPRGFKTTAGPRKQLKTTFRLEESTGGYGKRTRENIEQSHATLVLAHNMESAGTKLTIGYAELIEKPVYRFQLQSVQGRIQLAHSDLDAAAVFIEAQARNNCIGDESFKLNIAGNSSLSCPGIFLPAFVALLEILTRTAILIDQAAADQLVVMRQRITQNHQMLQALNDNFDYFGELDPRGMKGLLIM